MEAIGNFLAYACSRKIMVYQMDVKSSFLNGELEEEIYIEQPEGFLLPDKEDYVCRLKKALYGLKQAPRAWYDHLDRYLHQRGLKKGSIDNNLYVKLDQDNLRIIEGTKEYGLWYPKGNDIVIQAYTNADWAESVDDCKTTSGETLYLGGCLVSWLSKNKSSILLSTTEAEYIMVATCYTQVLWMKKTLQDLQVKFDEAILIFCDKTSSISISKNPMMHSKTKNILLKYHFVREKVAEKNIKIEYVSTKEQIADIFTKPLPHEAFEYLYQNLGILPSPH
eukprot:PITA_23045